MTGVTHNMNTCIENASIEQHALQQPVERCAASTFTGVAYQRRPRPEEQMGLLHAHNPA